MSEKRKYRTFTPEQKAEIVLAGLRGDRSVRDVCPEYEISDALFHQWRDRMLEGGKAVQDNIFAICIAIPAAVWTIVGPRIVGARIGSWPPAEPDDTRD